MKCGAGHDVAGALHDESNAGGIWCAPAISKRAAVGIPYGDWRAHRRMRFGRANQRRLCDLAFREKKQAMKCAICKQHIDLPWAGACTTPGDEEKEGIITHVNCQLVQDAVKKERADVLALLRSVSSIFTSGQVAEIIERGLHEGMAERFKP